MRKCVVGVAVALAIAAGQANGQEKWGSAMTVQTATFDRQSGTVIPAVTRLHPVIGSLQRTGRFARPFSHKTEYQGKMFNPVTGTVGTYTFKLKQ